MTLADLQKLIDKYGREATLAAVLDVLTKEAAEKPRALSRSPFFVPTCKCKFCEEEATGRQA